MNDLDRRGVEIVGRSYLDAITALLLRARSEDAMAGLWEAADPQWWWKLEPPADPAPRNRSGTGTIGPR